VAQWRFRPGDSAGSSLPSSAKETRSRAVIRVRVRKRKGTGEFLSVADAEPVMIIGECFRFTALTDFQYLTTSSFTCDETLSKTRVRRDLECTKACVMSAITAPLTARQLEMVPERFLSATQVHPEPYCYQPSKSSSLVMNSDE
jgi:hypothetical protein